MVNNPKYQIPVLILNWLLDKEDWIISLPSIDKKTDFYIYM